MDDPGCSTRQSPHACFAPGIAGVRAAQATAVAIPTAQLEVLPAGHVPYLGYPERVAELLDAFVGSGSN